MTRLVDADALMEIYAKYEFTSDMGDAMEILDNAPTVDAIPYDYILNIKEELRQKARESESQERKEFYLQNAEAIQRLLVTWEVKGRGTVRGYDQID
jgi:hypothetical protein